MRFALPRRSGAPFQVTVPQIVALVFGIFAAAAIGAVGTAAHAFRNEQGVAPWVFIAVPALAGSLFALVIYQGTQRRFLSVRQSISRGLLVALVTWFAVAALGSATWCLPRDFGACLSYALLLSGAIGGGPLLAAGIFAGVIGGLVNRYRMGPPPEKAKAGAPQSDFLPR